MASRRKIFRYILIALVVIVALFAWRLFGGNTYFQGERKILLIRTGSSFIDVQNSLERDSIVRNIASFAAFAKMMDYPAKLRPGKYVIEKGSSIFNIIRLLRSGRQTPVNLIITKLRTKEDFARKIAAGFESDSATVMRFFSSNDSLSKFGLDTNTVMSVIIPDTYTLLWTTTFPKIFKRLYSEQQRFWKGDREQKAKALGLTPIQVYTLASIVEEETTLQEDKGKIASVYLNRLQSGMVLGADPTIKFALKNFGLKRIYEKYLLVPSPYNTYINKGLPPGPICTPSQKTIDAVLNAPATNYLFFVAKPDLRGGSNFATTYQEHLVFAKAYQQALDSFMKMKTEAK